MSQKKFRLTADVYPKRINIDPTGSKSWSSLSNKVFEKMKSEDPYFDWSKYDSRTNYPNYVFDNSNTIPDSIADYVVVVFRYRGGWALPPVLGMDSWDGSGGGLAGISVYPKFSYNGYRFNCGYTHCAANVGLYGLFIHEMAHTLFAGPHYTNANSVHGKYFYGQGGYSMMSLGLTRNCALGWERWYLGWIDIKASGVSSDITTIDDLPANGEFILRDFITTGDVVRIKIPNGTIDDQYLWLENHQSKSVFDNRGWKTDGCGNGFPKLRDGIIAYIESIDGDRETPLNSIYLKYDANGIKFIHSKGNYDYLLGSKSNPCHYWGNNIYNVQEIEANAISGQSRSDYLRFDIDGDQQIFVNTEQNSMKQKNESIWLAQRNNEYTLDCSGSELAFETGQKIGLSTNPPLLNRPVYDDITSKTLTPFYLNGISVTIIEQYLNGDVKIKVSFNDINIDNSIRWCGNIHLPNITNNSLPDLIVNSNKCLTLNKSGTPNRHTLLNGKFVNPTEFYLNDSSYMILEANSKMIIEDDSKLILETGSKLEIGDGAILYIKSNAHLKLNKAEVIVNGSGKIIVECNGSLAMENGSSVTLTDANSKILFMSGHLVHPSTQYAIYMSNTGDGSMFTAVDRSLSSIIYSSDTYVFGKSISSQNLKIIGLETNVTIEAEEVYLGAGFEIEKGSTLDIDIYKNSCLE